MGTLKESNLVDAIRNKAVKRFDIVQTKNGCYRVCVNVTRVSVAGIWKEGDLELVTSRNVPREWVSLDRLARHICAKYGQLPNVLLVLGHAEDKVNDSVSPPSESSTS